MAGVWGCPPEYVTGRAGGKGRPLLRGRNLKEVNANIISQSQVCPGMHLVWLETPELAAAARPGQFVMVRCGEGYHPLLRRPLSIHRIGANGIALLFAVVGRGTGWLAERRLGDTLSLLGPLGNGFTLNPKTRDLLLVAGGIGIAPLMALAEQALHSDLRVRLLLGARDAAGLYPANLIPSRLETIVMTEDGSAGPSRGRAGLVTEPLPGLAREADQVFACGPLPMYRTLHKMRSKDGLRGKSVQVSLETRMGCGVGACYGCTIETRGGPRRVCRDGPVFELSEVLWDRMVEP